MANSNFKYVLYITSPHVFFYPGQFHAITVSVRKMPPLNFFSSRCSRECEAFLQLTQTKPLPYCPGALPRWNKPGEVSVASYVWLVGFHPQSSGRVTWCFCCWGLEEEKQLIAFFVHRPLSRVKQLSMLMCVQFWSHRSALTCFGNGSFLLNTQTPLECER